VAVNHTYAEINLKALYHNLALVKSKTSNKDIIAVVKANAYGHGAVTVSKALIQKGISKLGVAFTEEAVLLRNSGIDIPILVFFDRDNIDTCLRYNLTPVLFNLKTARQYSAAARKKNSTIPVHIKVDTGMGRVGFNLESAVSSIR
jgi:alanine racemase